MQHHIPPCPKDQQFCYSKTLLAGNGGVYQDLESDAVPMTMCVHVRA